MTTSTQPVLRNLARIPVLSFLNITKDLDPSYKMDLDFGDCFGGKKLCLINIEIWYVLFPGTALKMIMLFPG